MGGKKWEACTKVKGVKRLVKGSFLMSKIFFVVVGGKGEVTGVRQRWWW